MAAVVAIATMAAVVAVATIAAVATTAARVLWLLKNNVAPLRDILLRA